MSLIDRTGYICSLYNKYNNDLFKVLASQRELSEKYAGIPFFDDIEGELVYLLVRETQPQVCLEVGSGSGWSTSWIAHGLHDNESGYVIAVDINELAIEQMQQNLTSELLEHVNPICGDIPELDVPERIDFLHLDATHTEEFVRWFIGEIFHRVHGVVCTHDVFYQSDASVNWGVHTAKPLVEYLDENGLDYYTPANCFPDTHAPIAACREAMGITNIKKDSFNTTLVFHRI